MSLPARSSQESGETAQGSIPKRAPFRETASGKAMCYKCGRRRCTTHRHVHRTLYILRVVVRFPGTTTTFSSNILTTKKRSKRFRCGAMHVAAARRGVALFAERYYFSKNFKKLSKYVKFFVFRCFSSKKTALFPFRRRPSPSDLDNIPETGSPGEELQKLIIGALQVGRDHEINS